MACSNISKVFLLCIVTCLVSSFLLEARSITTDSIFISYGGMGKYRLQCKKGKCQDKPANRFRGGCETEERCRQGNELPHEEQVDVEDKEQELRAENTHPPTPKANVAPPEEDEFIEQDMVVMGH
ncbi:hypothetical protein IFM89_017888 [Coptis chinensis]|uniref:Uncharacterized protein n=1 Tax=Coptis chinensis TaxID=261450 RepID=A0A835I329_9MAGN|nr:hypothetical protein IFM89_017888 [Coptis chinensis]